MAIPNMLAWSLSLSVFSAFPPLRTSLRTMRNKNEMKINIRKLLTIVGMARDDPSGWQHIMKISQSDDDGYVYVTWSLLCKHISIEFDDLLLKRDKNETRWAHVWASHPQSKTIFWHFTCLTVSRKERSTTPWSRAQVYIFLYSRL